MPWIQIKLESAPEHVDSISDQLMDLGASAVTFEDAADQPLFEPDPGETKLWNATRIIGLFDANTEMSLVSAALKNSLGTETKLQINPVEDKDWERAWMDNFKPIRCGERLWICPSWHTPQDPEAINVMLDPGLAFGTGTHPTTALCLAWLDAHPPMGLQVVDYGCGSGILAVAAALLGAAHIDGVDHDPQALLASRDNASKNSVEDKISVYLPRDYAPQQVDLVLANILATPLMTLAEEFSKIVKPGGNIVLSGILAAQADALLERYSEWFTMEPAAQHEDWVRLTGNRK